jgi:hypothetical protein
MAKRELSELREEVYSLLGADSKNQFTDADINVALSRAQRELVLEGDLLKKNSTASSVADQERYSLPTDLLKMLRVDYDGYKVDRGHIDDIDQLDVT